jgi:hypothetical protein
LQGIREPDALKNKKAHKEAANAAATQRRVEQIQRMVALRIIAGAGRGGMNPQVLSVRI